MRRSAARREFADRRTCDASGFSHVTASLNFGTPFGASALAKLLAKGPYLPGEEAELKAELERTRKMYDFLETRGRKAGYVYVRVFRGMTDIDLALDRCGDNVLTIVELYKVKDLLLRMEKMREILTGEDMPREFIPDDIAGILNEFDPDGKRDQAFYIYDSFSEKLSAIRSELGSARAALRRAEDETYREIIRKYGVSIFARGEFRVSRGDSETLEKLKSGREFEIRGHDHSSIVFGLSPSSDTDILKMDIERLESMADGEEYSVRERLTKTVFEYRELLYGNCDKIGAFDLSQAKAVFARSHGCVMPEISNRHIIEITAGSDVTAKQSARPTADGPGALSVKCAGGVTYITGPNMSGKTAAARMVPQTAILAQYGFFVSCAKAVVGLSDHVSLITKTDGFSGFADRMEEIASEIKYMSDRTLLAIHDFAGGTDPDEAYALTCGFLEYLRTRISISLVTSYINMDREFDGAEGIKLVSTGERGGSIELARRAGIDGEIIEEAEKRLGRGTGNVKI